MSDEYIQWGCWLGARLATVAIINERRHSAVVLSRCFATLSSPPGLVVMGDC